MNKAKKTVKASPSKTRSAYDTFQNWAVKNDKKLFYGSIILSVLLSLISFNARISEAHDDALYLEGGWRFVNEFPNYFYTQNAPLYPMFLGLLIKIFGFNLLLFKIFSVAFNALGVALFYKALSKKVPAVVFIPALVFQAANHLIIYYSSMTFTEAFYFFFQGMFFYTAVKIVELVETENVKIRSQLKWWLMFGASMLLMSTVKSSAIVVIPATLLFFFIQKNYKAAGVALASFLLFKLPYDLIVKMIWHPPNQFQNQSKILLQKDPYNASLGKEDAAGFVGRFIDNCNLYLGKRFYQLLGWRDENFVTEKTLTEQYGFVTLLTIVIIIVGFWLLLKHRNKFMILLALFSVAQAALSFVMLQARWDQARIILVAMPVILMVMLYGFYHFTRNSSFGRSFYFVLASLVMGSVVLSSLNRGIKNIPIVHKNLKGDKYYGYTPDWQNFLKCSEWCADSLPANALVASRKAPMSFVYGKGKKFFPIYSVIKKDSTTEQSHPDSALAYFKANKVTHVMLGSLRIDPRRPDAGVINTVHNILVPIVNKYPNKLRPVHVQGETEVTEVYEIIY
jgi:hypothetical protein